ncbi:MAG: response regulator transcription factor [Flavobacteriales bacterium]|nr:response regulator transcription factor [Flavobacteriales bacterium]
MKTGMIRVAIADDHVLLRKGLVQLLSDSGFKVVADADNGKELIKQLIEKETDIVLMDINMPVMNGMETTHALRREFPSVKVIALSMFDDEMYVIRMIGAGARGYVLKDSEPSELRRAIIDVYEKGFHYSELVTGKLVHHIADQGDPAAERKGLTDREEEFLKYCCSELTYKEIAAKMNVSPRTVDGYRDALFDKLQLKSRVGLALYAVRNKMAEI